MTISKPIFVVGTGRSGSTIFHQILCEHPEVSWLSEICNRYPAKPWLNRYAMYAMNYSFVDNLNLKWFRPCECYSFWEYYCTGFRRPCRDLLATDVTLLKKERIQNALTQLTVATRKRLLIKLTGWPRMGFLQEIFPDAKFIHIIRDGRAVVNSFLNVEFWEGWGGPEKWRWGELPSEYKVEWHNSSHSFCVLAAIQWKLLMDSYELAKTKIQPSHYLEIKYEDFCLNTDQTLKNILEFCELQPSKKFDNAVKSYSLNNTNEKWQSELTQPQQEILTDTLSAHLKRYGYL